MEISIIGMGAGRLEALGADAAEKLRQADLIIGAARLLEAIPDSFKAERINEYSADKIMSILISSAAEKVCAVFSGDIGFYSGAGGLIKKLREENLQFRCFCAPSSPQLMAAALGKPWQDWELISAHGKDFNLNAAVLRGKPLFFLTDSVNSPAGICSILCKLNYGNSIAHVGENLGCPNERITTGTVEEISRGSYSKLSVLLVELSDAPQLRSPGFPDEEFVRGDVPMTKQEVRAAILAKLAIKPGDILWDIGAGTGSVSVEMARIAPEGEVWAVECNAEALELMTLNRDKFHAHNMHIVGGMAPAALEKLPAPDAVFIGGTKGALPEIVRCVLKKNPEARICVSAIAIDTLSTALTCFKDHCLQFEITQLSVSRTRNIGGLNMLMANNPIFLITGKRHV